MDKKSSEGNEGVTMNSKAQLIIVFLIGFLAGLLVGPTFTGDSATPNDIKDDESILEEEVETKPEVVPGDVVKKTTGVAGSATAMDQLAGEVVVVQSVEAPAETWVVVRETVNGNPANILGAQRVPKGLHTNVHVQLLRGTEANNSYFVMLYADSNENGNFDVNIDLPYTAPDGGYISDTFQTIVIDKRN